TVVSTRIIAHNSGVTWCSRSNGRYCWTTSGSISPCPATSLPTRASYPFRWVAPVGEMGGARGPPDLGRPPGEWGWARGGAGPPHARVCLAGRAPGRCPGLGAPSFFHFFIFFAPGGQYRRTRLAAAAPRE